MFVSSSSEIALWAKSCDPTTMLRPHQRDDQPCPVYPHVISLVVQHHDAAAVDGAAVTRAVNDTARTKDG